MSEPTVTSASIGASPATPQPASSLTFALDNLRGQDKAPLHHRYPGQTSHQPAYIRLSEDGEVRADWSGEVGGGKPEHVWNRRTLEFGVSAFAKPEVLADLLESGAARPLLERIYAGHSVFWDGSNNKGRLNEDAQAASDDLEDLLRSEFEGGDPTDLVQVWLVGDYLFNSGKLLDHWGAGQDLAGAVANIEAQAQSDGLVLDGTSPSACWSGPTISLTRSATTG